MPHADVIDDHRETAESLAGMLNLLGYTSRISLGPLPAMEALAIRVPEVIFLDIHMHGVNGVEVCRFIRREPSMAHVPIIAISMDTQPELIERARLAGADGFLSKPIGMDELEDVLRAVEARAAARAAERANGASAPA